ncbi:YadA-like C-terminal region [Phocoenobacter uteri]|uniref:YadA-like C-terminal region n=1 Tax=Phocoenobacter uteri TaxID=146806 RepID=A0A379C8F5_9PAST|nr:YadA-like family protein [Phocoenobacter uteri]MDG6882252.1 hypothetical protein [Phocoenobacter uteri]SUB58408.1 YadA-like C-terminal region [Phocoenobacter uteri]
MTNYNNITIATTLLLSLTAGTAFAAIATARAGLNSVILNDGTASGQNAIVGGILNHADGVQSAVIGGAYNNVKTTGGKNSALFGGYKNTIENSGNNNGIFAGDNNTINNVRDRNIIVGSQRSTITGASSFDNVIIGGGDTQQGGNKIINGDNNTVIGGLANIITGDGKYYDNNSILGGHTNNITKTAKNAAIVAGNRNKVEANNSAIVGGANGHIKSTGTSSVILGGGSQGANTITGIESAILAGHGHKIEGAGTNTSAIIAGRSHTVKADDAVIIGGGEGSVGNTVDTRGENAIIAGGYGHKVNATNTGILGGHHNEITHGESVILGGSNNKIKQENSAILAGGRNEITGSYSIVSGNTNKTSGNQSVILGGNSHISSGVNSVILGGNENGTTAKDSVVFGGYDNKITAGEKNFILGGKQNRVSGTLSGAIGGVGNNISGSKSYAIGGGNTVASTVDYILGENNNIRGRYNYIIGSGNTSTQEKVYILGSNVDASGATRAVVLGDGSTAVTDAVSVGTEAAPRNIKHVKDGLISDTSLDAINGSQVTTITEKGVVNDKYIAVQRDSTQENGTAPHINAHKKHYKIGLTQEATDKIDSIETKANKNADNLSEADVTAWKNKLGVVDGVDTKVTNVSLNDKNQLTISQNNGEADLTVDLAGLKTELSDVVSTDHSVVIAGKDLEKGNVDLSVNVDGTTITKNEQGQLTANFTDTNSIETVTQGDGITVSGGTEAKNKNWIVSLSDETKATLSQVGKNKTNIEANKTAIADNSAKITKNQTAIEGNKTNIEANKTAIADNSAKITENQTAIEGNKTNIEANKTAIADNSAKITENQTAIEGNKTNIEANKTAIEKNKTALSKKLGADNMRGVLTSQSITVTGEGVSRLFKDINIEVKTEGEVADGNTQVVNGGTVKKYLDENHYTKTKTDELLNQKVNVADMNKSITGKGITVKGEGVNQLLGAVELSISDNAVTTDKIADKNVTKEKLSDDVQATLTQVTINKNNIAGNTAKITKNQTAIAGNTTQIETINNLLGKDIVDEKERQKLLKTYDVSQRGEVHTNSILTAIHNMNEEGIKFLHVNDETPNGVAPKDKVNDFDSSASGSYAIAIGARSSAEGKKSIAIGYGNTVKGNQSGAIGDPSIVEADNSYSVGNNNKILKGSDDSFVLGNNVTANVGNSVYLGANSTAVRQDSVTTGGLSKVDTATVNGITYGGFAGNTPSGIVSVGSVGKERRVQNVAAGKISAGSTDAINGSQLHQVITQLNQDNKEALKRAISGTAISSAIANLPQEYLPGRSMAAVGTAHYRGTTALAVGMSTISDNGKWILKGSVSSDFNQDTVFGGGAGYSW